MKRPLPGSREQGYLWEYEKEVMTRWFWAISKSHSWWHLLSPIPGETPKWSCSQEARNFFVVVVIYQNRYEKTLEGARHLPMSALQEGLREATATSTFRALDGKVSIRKPVSPHCWLRYIKHQGLLFFPGEANNTTCGCFSGCHSTPC